MKKIKGISNNITKEIIGKITHDKKGILRSKSDYIIISDNIFHSGYAATLSSKSQSNTTGPLIHSVTEINILKDGDIVAIYPDGNINVVFEIDSDHNSLFLTERCNANCIMCPQPPNNKTKDKLEQALRILSLMDKGIKHIGITGGEPTLLGDNLFQIIEIAKRKFPKTSLTLLTNAINLSDFNNAENFAKINHPDLLIDVPLYSDTDTEHNRIIRANGFYKTIQGIYNLAKLRQKVGIRIVIHKLNYKRLPQIAEFIYRNFPFVVHIAFMQMEITGYAKANLENLWIDPYDYNPELETAINNLRNRDLTVSIYNSQLCILPENLREYARQSISTWKNIYLPLCEKCKIKSTCPGFFESSLKTHSQYLNPL